jgi:hypothetical protein
MRTVKNNFKNRASLLNKGYEERSGSAAYETPFITVIDSEKIFYKDSISHKSSICRIIVKHHTAHTI